MPVKVEFLIVVFGAFGVFIAGSILLALSPTHLAYSDAPLQVGPWPSSSTHCGNLAIRVVCHLYQGPAASLRFFGLLCTFWYARTAAYGR